MKKTNLSVLFVCIGFLSGCSLIPSISPTEQPTEAPTEQPTETPIESIHPGEIPSGGVEVTMSEAVDALQSMYDNFNAKDGLEVKLSNANFTQIYDVEYYDYYYYDENGNYHPTETPIKSASTETIKLEDANAEIKIVGLKTAKSSKDLKASANGSLKYSYLDTDYPEGEIKNQLGRVEGYYKDGVVYASLNAFAADYLFGVKGFPEKFYTEVPTEEFDDEFVEETGLILPLLSDANINFIKSLVSEFDLEENIGISKAKAEQMIKEVTNKLFTVTKYDNEYLLSVNLTKDNLSVKVNEVLDELYLQGVFTLIYGETVTPSQFDEMKNEVLATVEDIKQGFSHAKLSILFDDNFFKSIAVDCDISIKNEGYDSRYNENSGQYEDYLSRISNEVYKGSGTVTFNYSDDITVSFPSFSTYKDLNESFKPENVVKRINSATGANRLERWEINYWTKNSYYTEVSNEKEKVVRYYLGVENFKDFFDNLKKGVAVDVIEVTFSQDGYYADAAQLTTQQGTFNGSFEEICYGIERDLYGYGCQWSLDEVIELLGEPTRIDRYEHEEYVTFISPDGKKEVVAIVVANTIFEFYCNNI